MSSPPLRRPRPMNHRRLAVPSLAGAIFLGVALVHGGQATLTASPVEKVVSFLTDLQKRIEGDGEREQQIYDKYACWCESTTTRKAEAIETAKTDLKTLAQDILSLKGKVATLASEIEGLTVDIQENEETQKDATVIRQKENKAFMAETAEMKQAIAALDSAIKVLSGASSAASAAASSALLQRRSSALADAKAQAVRRLQEAVVAAPARVVNRLANSSAGSPSRLALLRSVTEVMTHRTQAGAGYQPQSATIQGILADMYKTFGSDLQGSTAAEASANNAFEELMHTKQTELLQMQESLKQKEEDKAESERMMAEAVQAYDDTEAQMQADITFFDATTKSCEDKTTEWADRKKLREQELEGISKALTILTSDEARELFGKAIQPGVGFLQLSTQEDHAAAGPTKSAYEAIKKEATRTHSLRLASLAAKVRFAKAGHFDKVIEAIDKLLQELREEGAADVTKRDQCKEEYKKINSTIAELDWKIEVNEAAIQKLERRIEEMEKEKARTVESVKETEEQLVKMEATRTEENAEFGRAKSDDEAAIELLQKAKDAFSEFYKKNNIDVGVPPVVAPKLLQESPEFERSLDEAPEAQFSHEGHRSTESKGVMSILSMIINDLQGEISTSVNSEAEAQLDYEELRDAAKVLVKELTEKKTNLETAIAEAENDKTEEEILMKENDGARKEEVTYKEEITSDCDFIIGAFDKRRSSRQAEMDGLTSAKEFLSGYQKSSDAALLQGARRRPRRRPFDDGALERSSFSRLQSRSLRVARLHA